MGKRADTKKKSTANLHVRLTPEERAEMEDTAEHSRESTSEMLRRLHRQERHRLGLKPLRK